MQCHLAGETLQRLNQEMGRPMRAVIVPNVCSTISRPLHRRRALIEPPLLGGFADTVDRYPPS
jgi:hypothetical protein